MTQVHRFSYQSPIGVLEIVGNEEGIQAILFVEKKEQAVPSVIPTNEVAANLPVPVQQCIRQLDEYFVGNRTGFEVLLAPKATEFQQKVWEQLMDIPWGQTVTYGKIAKKIGQPKAAQAVGAANGQNPIPIIVPCHRVIGSSGALTGYAGGLWRKSWLLAHEKVKLPGKQLSLLEF